MLKDEAGPVDPVDVFKSGAQAGGNSFLAREHSFPLILLEKGDEVAKLADSSLKGKIIERPLLSRGNTGSKFAKYPGVLLIGLAFPYLNPASISRSGRSVSIHVRLGGQCAVTAAFLLCNAYLEEAREAQALVP